MNCPNCNIALVMADRQGVEIDYCPQCRGVWLDRGELDKIIERSSNFTAKPDAPQQYNPYKQDYTSSYPDPKYGHGHHHHDPYNKHHKKKGFLSDFFDFD